MSKDKNEKQWGVCKCMAFCSLAYSAFFSVVCYIVVLSFMLLAPLWCTLSDGTPIFENASMMWEISNVTFYVDVASYSSMIAAIPGVIIGSVRGYLLFNAKVEQDVDISL